MRIGFFVTVLIFLSCKEQIEYEPVHQSIQFEAKNIYNQSLKICSQAPLTGFYRDGKCNTGPDDFGTHIVCAVMTKEFLAFTQSVGNDLSNPVPGTSFKGLTEGDSWCLCVSRWQEAFEAGFAPLVKTDATHIKTLDYLSNEDLETFRVN